MQENLKEKEENFILQNQGKSIILLGSGPEWDRCPFDKETWAIAKLVVNNGSFFTEKNIGNGNKVISPNTNPLKRVDMLFNMDDVVKMLSFNPDSPHHVKYTLEDFCRLVNERNVPFITSYPHPELIPKSVAFPLREIYEKFGVFYYTNTICFMIAYAMFTGVESIDIWGVAQGGIKEYIIERRGVEFWIGLASGTGVKINIHSPTQLLTHDKNIVYGYKKPPIDLAKEFGFYQAEDENLSTN